MLNNNTKDENLSMQQYLMSISAELSASGKEPEEINKTVNTITKAMERLAALEQKK